MNKVHKGNDIVSSKNWKVDEVCIFLPVGDVLTAEYGYERWSLDHGDEGVAQWR